MNVQSILKLRLRYFLLLIILFLFLYVTWLLRGQDIFWERYWVGNLTIVFTGGLAACLAWSAGRKAISSAEQKAWLWITGGLGLWFLLDSLNLILLLQQQPQFLNAATAVAYFAGGLCLWVGLVIFPRKRRLVFSRTGLILNLVLIAGATALFLWDAWVRPLLTAPGVPPLTAFAYILVNIITMVLVLLLYFLANVEEMTSSLLWIFLAFLSYSFSDLNFIVLSNLTVYSPGTTQDLGWVLGDMLIIFAIYLQTQAEQISRASFLNRLLQRSQSLIPIISILLLGWYSILNWQLNGQLDTFSLWGTVILGLGLLVSQGIQTGEQAMERYAHLVNSIAEPAFVCDNLGNMRLVNHAFLEICRYPRSELFGNNIRQFFTMPPADLAWLKGLFAKPIPEADLDSAREMDLKTRDGDLIPVMLTLRSIEAGNRKQLAYAVTAHDLRLQKQQQSELLQAYDQVAHARTELERMNLDLEKLVNEKTFDLQQAYRTLEEQNKTLQQLDQIKSDFVSLVSHELRAPLTNIRGGIELLLATPSSQSKRSAVTLKRVQSEILRLSEFTETILDLSAMDANRLPLYLEPLDLHTVTTSLQQFYAQTQGGERIRWNIPPHTYIILADEKALHSVLFHLLDNALKYAPLSDVLVNAEHADEMVCIQVQDFGTGIPEETITHIFDRFFRANMADSQVVYGHGLGLYMVKRFIEAMNGSVVAQNGSPSGTVFCVYLPVIK